MRRSLVFAVLALTACGRSTPLQPRLPESGPTCALTVAPLALDFGTVQPNTHLDGKIALHNTGGANCGISDLAIAPDSDPAFSVLTDADGGTGLTVYAGRDAVLTVRYAPTRAEVPFARSGTLTFTTDDPAHEDVSVALEATLPHCTLQVAPDALEFGAVEPGNAVDRSTTLTNTGDGTCELSSASLTADSDPAFTLPGGGLTVTTLPPGGQLPVTVRFSTNVAAPPTDRAGTLVIASNDVARPSVKVPLTAELQFCDLAVSPNPFDFGNVVLNATVTDQLTLTNRGLANCTVSDVALARGTDSEFSLPNPPTTITIAPGQSANVGVTFAALDSAPPHQRTGNLTFSSNDATTPDAVVPLSAFINTVCTQAGQFIYTVDANGSFSRFNPVTRTSTDIGVLSCPSSGSPFSMHVDQSAIAWVLFDDGRLYRVDTADASCSATSYTPNQHNLMVFGMGSVFDSSSGRDTLYIAGEQPTDTASSTLATLDLSSFLVNPIGPIDVGRVEVAGTGDGQLWVFTPALGSTTGTPVLARLDRNTAQTLEEYDVSGITSVGGFAIKFFGGSFYIFVGEDVWQVDRASLVPGQAQPTTPPQLVFSNPGRDVVGAGVSTCAPVQ